MLWLVHVLLSPPIGFISEVTMPEALRGPEVGQNEGFICGNLM